MAERLRTTAWLLVGLSRSVPGELSAGQGRLSFRGADGTRFDAALADLSHIEFPWYYFGAGVHLTVAGRRYRLGFVRPTSEAGSIFDIGEGRRIGKVWKRVLSGESDLGSNRGA